MGHHNHSIQWQHNHSTIRWRITSNLQTISTTWRGWRNSPFVCSRLRKRNYPDEGVAAKRPTTPARFELPTRQTAAAAEAPEPPRKLGLCASHQDFLCDNTEQRAGVKLILIEQTRTSRCTACCLSLGVGLYTVCALKKLWCQYHNRLQRLVVLSQTGCC